MNLIKNFLKSFIVIFVSFSIGILLCEIILRVKHNFLINYDIEMWRYAKELKQKVANDKINHIHVPNKEAILQKVKIKINKYGQRDINLNKEDLLSNERRFLILGSSVAMGWGVKNEKTFSNRMNQLAKKNKKNWIFINGGVGNYNAERYINNYFENWDNLNFTDISIHFFVNDTEVIKASKTNFFTENFHLGVVLWKLINSYENEFKKKSLQEYYLERFKNDYPGFITAKKEFLRLSNHCKKQKINCHMIVMPDIHKLNPYDLNFINKKMRNISKVLSFSYLDLLEEFQKYDETKLWNKYKDPHPNEYAHTIMGERVFNFLNK